MIFLSASQISCNEWLDVNATNQLDRDKLFQTESGYAEALTGVYAALCDESLYGKTLSFQVLDLMSNYYTSVSGDNYYWLIFGYANPADQYGVNACLPYIENVWVNFYKQIANLNSILATIDENEDVFSGDNYQLIKGECIGLRAFLHFEILRLFAEAYNTGKDKSAIPYVNILTSLVAPILTQEQVIDNILGDLKTAKTLLEKDPMHLGISPEPCLASLPSGTSLSYDNIPVWHNRRFRFNYYAVVATMARVYLWKGDHVNALAAANEIIAEQDSKFPWVNVDDLTGIGSTYARNQDRTFAREHIFALNVTDMEDKMDGLIFAGESGALSYLALDVTGEERSEVYEGYFADYRYQYWFQGNAGNWLLSKFYQNDVTARYFQERLPLIRLSEMYYIAAECLGGSEGIAMLENVRVHRGLSSYTLPSTADLDTEIRKEYEKEFWGEGQLWFYYKRKSFTAFSSYMTNVSFFTWAIPDEEISIGGRD